METNAEVNQVQEIAQEPVQAIAETQESPQERNWKLHREKMEAERKEKQEAQRKAAEKAAEAEALKQALEAVLNKQAQRPSEEVFEVDEEEERIQKRIDKAFKDREEQYEAQRKQREVQELPQRLSSEYKDFDQICSRENIDYLEYHHPEIAKGFHYMPDGFDKWSCVYKAIKKLVPNTSEADKKKISQNLNKPQSMAVSGVTQVGDGAPVMPDEARRAANYQRMLRVMKGV